MLNFIKKSIINLINFIKLWKLTFLKIWNGLGWFIYLFKGISTIYGLFKAEIQLISKC